MEKKKKLKKESLEFELERIKIQLRERRKKMGLTMEEVSEKTAMNRNSLFNIEKTGHYPNFFQLLSLCNFYGVEIILKKRKNLPGEIFETD